MLPATIGAIAAALAKAQGELSRQPSATQRLSNARRWFHPTSAPS
jgi:hypothetical protein